MYKSPIDIIYGQMETQLEGTVLKAVQNVGVNVDKEELIRALKYDRNQYDKGYADGKRDAMNDLGRCKGCYYYESRNPGHGFCNYFEILRVDNDFCSSWEERQW